MIQFRKCFVVDDVATVVVAAVAFVSVVVFVVVCIVNCYVTVTNDRILMITAVCIGLGLESNGFFLFCVSHFFHIFCCLMRAALPLNIWFVICVWQKSVVTMVKFKRGPKNMLNLLNFFDMAASL